MYGIFGWFLNWFFLGVIFIDWVWMDVLFIMLIGVNFSIILVSMI